MISPSASRSIFGAIVIAGLKSPGQCLMTQSSGRTMEGQQSRDIDRGPFWQVQGDTLLTATYTVKLWQRDLSEATRFFQRLEQARISKERVELNDPVNIGKVIKVNVQTIGTETFPNDGMAGTTLRTFSVIEWQKGKKRPAAKVSTAAQAAYQAGKADRDARRAKALADVKDAQKALE